MSRGWGPMGHLPPIFLGKNVRFFLRKEAKDWGQFQEWISAASMLKKCFLNNLSKMRGGGAKSKSGCRPPCPSTQAPAILVLDRYRFYLFSSDFEIVLKVPLNTLNPTLCMDSTVTHAVLVNKYLCMY